MSAGDAPRVELPPEFQPAFEKLHRLFAGALHDAKFNSCWSAWTDIQRIKSAKKKIEIFNEKFEQWREGSANAIREWLPKFVDLATANPEVIDDPIHWAKDSVWENVEGTCGIQRTREDEPLGIDRVVNDIAVWWFAVASEGNPEINLPPLQPWSAPRWLARDGPETNELLEKHAGYLWLRVNCVINEEIDLAEIQRACNRKVEEHKAEPQSSKRAAYQGVSASRVSPDEKATALLPYLEGTLERDLLRHRKGAIISPKTQEPKLTKVAPAQPEMTKASQPEMTRASKASELFFAWWPSSSFPSPGWPDIVQNFKCAHRILTTNGFLIVADPENLTGDGKSWVLECKATAKLPEDTDPPNLARQCLESEGVRVDEVGQLDESDRTIYVLLGPPPQPTTSVMVRGEPRTEKRTKLLQMIYGAEVAKLSAISSGAITKEWIDAHDGENPPSEPVARGTMKRSGQRLGVTPKPLPQPEAHNSESGKQSKVTPMPPAGPTTALRSTGQRRVNVPPKTLENAKHTILSRVTAAVSGILFQNVTGVCKRLFKIHYESPEEIDQAPEWQELNKLFCDACDTYVNIAMGNRRKIRGDLFVWVKEKIEADEKAISVQHFSCDANGYLVSDKASILVKHDDTWSAMQHVGWLTNINVASGVFRSHIALAKSVALGNAAIRIASGSTSHHQPANQDTSATRARSQARSLPIRSSAPLSKFETTVGKLMIRARRSCPTKYLPQAEILKIAVQLDDKNLPVLDNLEREAARAMAEYNQRHPTSAIKSWRVALSLPQFRRAVRKRFWRAEEKCRKATPSILAPSAGTPRTTI